MSTLDNKAIRNGWASPESPKRFLGRAPIVGWHFVPPAETLLRHLPVGLPLILEPDPGNPYDAEAIKVMVSSAALRGLPTPIQEALSADLPNQGATWETLIMDGEALWPLGHVARSGGAPLAKAQLWGGSWGTGSLCGNHELLGWIMDPGLGPRLHVTLTYAPGGQGLVEVRVDDEGERPSQEPLP